MVEYFRLAFCPAIMSHAGFTAGIHMVTRGWSHSFLVALFLLRVGDDGSGVVLGHSNRRIGKFSNSSADDAWRFVCTVWSERTIPKFFGRISATTITSPWLLGSKKHHSVNSPSHETPTSLGDADDEHLRNIRDPAAATVFPQNRIDSPLIARDNVIMPMDPDGFVMKTSFVQDEDHGLLHVETSSDDDVSALIYLAQSSGDACPWHRILQAIHRNPSLLTHEIFFKALQQNPPQPVVLQMLRVAPQIASLPPSGPTALQVALQSGASLGVIRALLEVSPFALCVTRSCDAIDPLSYAKQHRSKETDLIELLNRPLSYWLSQVASHPTEGGAHPSDAGQVIDKPAAHPVGPASHEKPSPLPPGLTEASTATNITPLVDRQELDNVKCLCAQVLKGHKRLARQLELFQTQLQEKNESSATKTSSAVAQRVLETLKEEQNNHFRIQLLALDMKERAFDARAKRMEERCLDQFDEQLTQWKKTHEHSLCTRQTSELKGLLDREVSMNEQCHRERSSQRMQVYRWQDNQAGQEVVLWEKNHFPGFFPMNLAELEEPTPLNVTSTSFSDGSENPDSPEPPSPSRRRRGIGRFRHPREPSVRRCFLNF